MTDQELFHTIRETYRRVMETRQGDEQAFAECAAILKEYLPNEPEEEVRMRIARIIAGEPIAGTSELPTSLV